MRADSMILLLAVLLLWGYVAEGFVGQRGVACRALQGLARSLRMAEGEAPKGFGKPVEKKVEVVEEDAGTRTYASQAKRGVPEYNIFMRPRNGTETEWVPVGSMTIPRDTPVGKAVYDVEAELLKGTFKLYPKLKAFSDTRANKEGIFEYGYVLKAFPDEQINLIPSPEEEAEKANSQNFFQRWLGSVTNPLDATELNGVKGQVTLKQ
jgi:Family of unknown function (DUF6523)